MRAADRPGDGSHHWLSIQMALPANTDLAVTRRITTASVQCCAQVLLGAICRTASIAGIQPSLHEIAQQRRSELNTVTGVGHEHAFCAAVNLGISNPLLVDLISSIALLSGALPSVVIEIFCEKPTITKIKLTTVSENNFFIKRFDYCSNMRTEIAE